MAVVDQPTTSARQLAFGATDTDRQREPRESFDAQNAIDWQREDLIKRIEEQMQRLSRVDRLFGIRWTLK